LPGARLDVGTVDEGADAVPAAPHVDSTNALAAAALN
jgi:hypothetical protein